MWFVGGRLLNDMAGMPLGKRIHRTPVAVLFARCTCSFLMGTSGIVLLFPAAARSAEVGDMEGGGVVDSGLRAISRRVEGMIVVERRRGVYGKYVVVGMIWQQEGLWLWRESGERAGDERSSLAEGLGERPGINCPISRQSLAPASTHSPIIDLQ